MWAATSGLRLFIMKGIHRSVPALPLSTQFFHTGPPSLPLVPSLLSVPLFAVFHISFSIQFWGKGGLSAWKTEREIESEWREGADLQDSLETSVGPCLSLLLAPVPSTGGGLCAQERLLYLGICGAPLGGWREGGGAPQASAPL